MPGIEWTVKSTREQRTVNEVERVLTSKGTATRQRIVAGAAALVRDQGPANVSLDDIRTATSTSKSQLFHYFPDGKSDLLLAVARYEAQQVLDDQQPMLGDLTSWAAWLRWRDRVIEKYRAQGPGCPLSALTSQLGLADPATRTVVTELYARWHGYLADGVRALIAAGEIDPATHSGDAATAVLTAVAGGATLLMATGEIGYLETALGEAMGGLRRQSSSAAR
jgi:AcrR family transcriptional regulator